MLKTSRGFDVEDFIDIHGSKCSIQKSSLAGQDAIWFGVDLIKPFCWSPGQGWISVEVPEDTQYNGRMHLSQEQVRYLLPFLQKFAETGELT